ncbi:MAG: iron-sulfur cluster assembly scaffold protein, partial [Anaerolineae bacterium]
MTGDQDLARLYQQALMRESLDPAGRDRPLEATHSAHGDNPLCGDVVEMRLRVEAGTVAGAAFSGQAC